jgi:hypothetical protein
MTNQYDSHTAITFLLAGLGIGALVALFFARSSRGPGLERRGRFATLGSEGEKNNRGLAEEPVV